MLGLKNYQNEETCLSEYKIISYKPIYIFGGFWGIFPEFGDILVKKYDFQH